MTLSGFNDTTRSVKPRPNIPDDIIDSGTQPTDRVAWDAIVLSAPPARVNRWTLRFAVSVASTNPPLDSVGGRYVRRYLDLLSSDDCKLRFRRGLVCELLWMNPDMGVIITDVFLGAVGHPDCHDWQSIPLRIREEFADTLEASDPGRWKNLDLKLCGTGDKSARRIRRHLCDLPTKRDSRCGSRVPPSLCLRCQAADNATNFSLGFILVILFVSLIIWVVNAVTERPKNSQGI